MGRRTHSSAASPSPPRASGGGSDAGRGKNKFQLSELDLYRKTTTLLLSYYAPVASLAYYNSLENGLAIALHHAPTDLDWCALRRGQRTPYNNSKTKSKSKEKSKEKSNEKKSKNEGEEGKDAAHDAELMEDNIDDAEEAGVCRPLTRMRRAWRHADDEIRSGFFIPGFWSRSGAKQDLAESLSAARMEVKALLEKTKGWWNADLIADLDSLADAVDAEIKKPLLAPGHHDYYAITNKTEEYSARMRRLVLGADEVRKEFIRLAKEQLLDDPAPLTRAMHKHFDWADVHEVLERRR